MAGLFLGKEQMCHFKFDSTFESKVSVTPKNDERVPSNPDITSGIRSFRMTMPSPMPNALKIPITFLLRRQSFSTKDRGRIMCTHSLPAYAGKARKIYLADAGREKQYYTFRKFRKSMY
jgi:hypothetical protein